MLKTYKSTQRFPTRLGTLTLSLLVAALTLATLVFNAYNNANDPYWIDEAYSVVEVRASNWHELIQINLANEETPPLYFAALRIWAQLWGDSHESTLRLFSAFTVAATVPVLAILGYWFWGKQASLLAATLMAVNPLAHFYGRETRSYALAILLTSITLLAAVRYRQHPSWRSWIFYIVAAAALLYTNYLGGFMIGGIAVVIGRILLAKRGTAQRLQGRMPFMWWAAAQLCLLLLLMPWLNGIRYQYHLVNGQLIVQPHSIGLWYQQVRRMGGALLALAAGHHSQNTKVWMVIVWWAHGIAVLSTCLVGLCAYRKSMREIWLWWIAGAIVPLGCIVLVFTSSTYFDQRYATLVLPAYIIVLAVVLTRIYQGGSWAKFLPFVLVMISLTQSFQLRRSVPSWDKIATVTAQLVHDGDTVFFEPPWTEPAFWVQYTGPDLVPYSDGFVIDHKQGWEQFDTLDMAALQRSLTMKGRVWLVWDHSMSPLTALPSHIQVVEKQTFGAISLMLLRSTGTPMDYHKGIGQRPMPRVVGPHIMKHMRRTWQCDCVR